MGVDTIVWIHKDDLKKMDFADALFIYKTFQGRWNACVTDKFFVEGNTISLDEVKKSMQYDSRVHQSTRDLIKRLDNLRIIFQADYIEEDLEEHIDLSFCLRKGWEDITGAIK